MLTHTRLRDFGPSEIGWIVSAQDPSQQKKVAGLPESTRRAAFTHQGNGLVLFAKCEKDSPEGCSDIFTFDLASGTGRNLTANLKDSTLASDQLTVSEDDSSVLVGITHGMKRTVAVVDLNDGHVRVLDLGMPTISAFRQGGTGSRSASNELRLIGLDLAGERIGDEVHHVLPRGHACPWLGWSGRAVLLTA